MRTTLRFTAAFAMLLLVAGSYEMLHVPASPSIHALDGPPCPRNICPPPPNPAN
ncbi:MAG TPA: hypothetical protein VKH81_14950 [Candidatus Angelobacter sp.]|nr:hypothetical protein [Candidatus Angelobacter sp.]